VNASVLGKNLFYILTPIEHTNDFRPIIIQTIEHNLKAGGERAQTRSNFIARLSCKRKIVDCRNNLANVTQESVGGYAPRRTRVINPKAVNVIECSGDQIIRDLCSAMS
jgi:hypothetical protein